MLCDLLKVAAPETDPQSAPQADPESDLGSGRSDPPSATLNPTLNQELPETSKFNHFLKEIIDFWTEKGTPNQTLNQTLVPCCPDPGAGVE